MPPTSQEHSTFEIVIAVIGGVWFLYVYITYLIREFKRINRDYREAGKRIDAEHKREMARIDAEYKAKMAALKIDHDFNLRKIYEDTFDSAVADTLAVGDWILWLPCSKPVIERYGQIVEEDRTKCCFKVRAVIDGAVVENWHNCSQGAKMRKINALDLFTREISAEASTLDGGKLVK